MARLFDNAGAKDWLEGKPNVAHVAFAARSAARSLARLGEANEATLDQITLPVMRAIITSVAVSIKFEAEIKFAADRSFPDAGDATVVARAAGAISAAFVAASADNAADCAASSGNKSSAAAAASTGASAFQSSEAAFWCETSLDAETLEAGTPEQLWTTKLWRLNDGPPQDAIATLSALRAYWLKNSAIWGFWERWYDGMLNGQPLPWDFQEAVALIPDDVWEAGAEAVAKRIKEIEDEFYSLPDLDEAQLASTVERIISQPVLFRDAAEAAGLKIEATIAAYKADFANGLPEGFEAFEKLPPVYSNVAQIIDQGIGADEIERLRAEIKHLHSVIGELKRDLRDAREQLRDKRLNAVEVAQMRTFGERLQTTLACITSVGALGMSTALFFGYGKEDLNYEGLKQQIEGLSVEMAEIEPHPEFNEPEETLKGPKFVKPPSK